MKYRYRVISKCYFGENTIKKDSSGKKVLDENGEQIYVALNKKKLFEKDDIYESETLKKDKAPKFFQFLEEVN